jgi:hypothetical protein
LLWSERGGKRGGLLGGWTRMQVPPGCRYALVAHLRFDGDRVNAGAERAENGQLGA